MNDVELEDVACPIGCPRADDIVVQASDRLHSGPGIFTVVRCKNCGLMRTTPRPVQSAMSAYYPDDYAPYRPANPTVATNRRRKSRAWHCVQQVVDSRAQWVPELPPGNLLEFGCAGGAYLSRMRAAGWNVTGVDIGTTATDRARAAGLSVHTGHLETMPDNGERFDLVVGWMALEHLHDPIAALRLLHERTRSDGWLVVSVPDAGALEFRLLGPRWYSLHLPAHLFHFTPETLRATLRRGGWQMERVIYQRSAMNLAGSLGHLITDLGFERIGHRLVRAVGRSQLLGYLLLPLGIMLGLLRQSGRITVWASRMPRA